MSEYKLPFKGSEIEDKLGKIDDLSVFVTPQMFGAKGDGVTDDTTAFRNAIANASSLIVVPSGTYLITDTLTINKQVLIEGSGSESSIINYTGTGYLFNISTDTKTRAVIRKLNFLGTETNSLIYCNKNTWGSSFKMEDCLIRIFGGTIFDLISASGVSVLNTRIIASGVIKARPYDETKDNGDTLSNVNYFEGVYFTGYPRENTNNLFELQNAQYFSFRNCAFEAATNVFSLTTNCKDIVLNECNIEQVNSIYSCDSTSEAPKFLNIRIVHDVGKFNKNSSAVDHINTSSESKLGMVIRNNSDTMDALFNDSAVPLYKKTIVNKNTNKQVTIYDMSTHGFNTILPINTQRSIYINTNSINYDLKQCTDNVNVGAIYDIDALIEYSDNSYRWITASVFGNSFENMFIGNTMIKKASAEATKADADIAVFQVNNTNLTYASDLNFARLTLVIRTNVTGQAQ